VPLALDAEVYPKELTLETARALEALEPCGHGNRQPHLLLRSVRIEQLSRTRDGKHLRFRVRAGRHAIKAVFFGGADCEGQLRSPLGVDLAAKLTVSTWDGDPAPELHVVDGRPAT
jgi:single-stranded DNA-specific DHH superfamily exonuclease